MGLRLPGRRAGGLLHLHLHQFYYFHCLLLNLQQILDLMFLHHMQACYNLHQRNQNYNGKNRSSKYHAHKLEYTFFLHKPHR